MLCDMTSLADINARRRKADRLARDEVLAWLATTNFCRPIRSVARWAIADPRNPEATHELLKQLMVQVRRLRGVPVYYTHMRGLEGCESHRMAFRAVARVYLKQRRAQMAEAAE